MKLKDLILENECTYLDFKAIEYKKEKYDSFIKDVVAMANAHFKGDKFIILGIKDIPGEEKKILGLGKVTDESTFQSIIHENIEPFIDISYTTKIYEEKTIGIVKISNCSKRPYLLKKDRKNLKKGDGFIRRGSRQMKLERSDYDEIYSEKSNEQFEMKKLQKDKEEIKAELSFLQTLLEDQNNYDSLAKNFNFNLSKCKEYLSPYRGFRCIPEGMSERNFEISLLNNLGKFKLRELNNNFYHPLLYKINHERVGMCKKEYNDTDIQIKKLIDQKNKSKEILDRYINNCETNGYNSSIFRDYSAAIQTLEECSTYSNARNFFFNLKDMIKSRSEDLEKIDKILSS